MKKTIIFVVALSIISSASFGQARGIIIVRDATGHGTTVNKSTSSKGTPVSKPDSIKKAPSNGVPSGERSHSEKK